MPTKRKAAKRSNKVPKKRAGFMQKLKLKFGKNFYPVLALVIGLIVGASGYYIYQQNYSGAGSKKTVKLYIFSDNGRFDKVSISSGDNTKPCLKASYPLSGKKRASKSGRNPIEANCRAGSLGFRFIKNNKVLSFYSFDKAEAGKCYLVHADGVTKSYYQVDKKCVATDKENEPDKTQKRATSLTIKSSKQVLGFGSRVTISGTLNSTNEELSEAECKEDAASKMQLSARFIPQRAAEVHPADSHRVPVKMNYKKGICNYSFKTEKFDKHIKEYTNVSFATDFAGTDNLAPSVSPPLTLKTDKK